MTTHDRAILEAILRRDIHAFAHFCFLTLNPGAQYLPNWHILAILQVLEAVRLGYLNRVIINLPPRYLKSILTSVVFPAFWLGHEPTKRIVALSYGNELTSMFTGHFRSIVTSNTYQRLFPEMRLKRISDEEITTTKRGFRKATSVGGALTGIGGSLFIIDDPQKPVDAQSPVQRTNMHTWFANTLLSRLDNKVKDAIILVQQRVHMDDLSGYLIGQRGDWYVLSIPAIAEADENIPVGWEHYYRRRAGEALHAEREPLKILENYRQQMGADTFSAQYQQCPVPPGGAMIQGEWLRRYTEAPERTSRDKVIQSWDTAAKEGAQNSYSVCTTWLVKNKRDYYLLDLTRGRFAFPPLKAKAIELAERFNPNRIIIEDASTGVALAPELRQILHRSIELIPVDRDKIGRMYVQTDKFAGGHVFFPMRAPFLAELEQELLSFPNGRTDDQVDSISQALAYKLSYYTLDNVR